jgi:hypothetical protein
MGSNELKKRQRDMATPYKTLYSQDFGTQADRFGIRTSPDAFDGIMRNGFQPHFDHWRKHASEEQVSVIADTCRSLRVFASSKGPPTCYKDMFPRYRDEDIKPPKLAEFDKNMSNVPLGNLNSMSAEEKQRRANHDKAQEEMLAAAVRRNQDVRNGSTDFRSMRPPSLPAQDVRNDSEVRQLMKQGALSNSWKSSIKASYIADVHARGQANRYGSMPVLNAAERARLECAATPSKRILTPALMERSHSAPTLNMNTKL